MRNVHAQLLRGRCPGTPSERDDELHVRATVEFFLRAYARDPERVIAL